MENRFFSLWHKTFSLLRKMESCANLSPLFCGFPHPRIVASLEILFRAPFLIGWKNPHFYPHPFSTVENFLFRLFSTFLVTFPPFPRSFDSTPVFLAADCVFANLSTPDF
ncbi:MAG: hypothetical protein IJW29_02755 [Clostridia bacterium]|nr:hypothetical protein [Clostridia bacterium]